MHTEWQANPRVQQVQVKRLQLRRAERGGLVALRVRVFRSTVFRMTEAGREEARCEHQHSTQSSALKCAQSTAKRMNRNEVAR